MLIFSFQSLPFQKIMVYSKKETDFFNSLKPSGKYMSNLI
jgi:hypothetical protein